MDSDGYKMAKPKIKIGEKFNRLTIINEYSRNGKRLALCRCECGTEKEIKKCKVTSGETKSCGCLVAEASRKTINEIRKTRILSPAARSRMGGATRFIPKHGARNTPEYHIWVSMKARCLNHNCENYESYGNRGIVLCNEWRDSFESFLNDMGKRPSPSHSLDRINNDGDYRPDNCRWATPKEQQRNKRTNRRIKVDGTEKTLAEWSEITGIRADTITRRIDRGWSEKEAITIPVHGKQK